MSSIYIILLRVLFLVVATLSVFGILITLQLGVGPTEVQTFLSSLYKDEALVWPLVLVFAFLFVLSMRFVFLGINNSSQDEGVEHVTDIGYVSISLETIESISLRVAKKIKGVSEVTARVRHNKKQETIGVGLKVVVEYDVSIPQLADELQILVKEQVESTTGVLVETVSVYIAHTKKSERQRSHVRVS